MYCRECGSKMYIDDRDITIKNNYYDLYWNCPNCITSCIEEVRFSNKFRELWHSENNDKVKYLTLKVVKEK